MASIEPLTIDGLPSNVRKNVLCEMPARAQMSATDTWSYPSSVNASIAIRMTLCASSKRRRSVNEGGCCGASVTEPFLPSHLLTSTVMLKVTVTRRGRAGGDHQREHRPDDGRTGSGWARGRVRALERDPVRRTAGRSRALPGAGADRKS